MTAKTARLESTWFHLPWVVLGAGLYLREEKKKRSAYLFQGDIRNAFLCENCGAISIEGRLPEPDGPVEY
ncbi:hypothetical protein Hhel01_02566 [Haloferula helveola]